MEWMFNHSPWFSNNNLLVWCRIQPREILSQVFLFWVPFWVQVHEVSVDFMMKTVGHSLGNYKRKFMEYDEKNNKEG